jgi:thiol-disulfide isomerase/thioredoxin
MKLWVSTILMAVLLQQPDAETRVINYLKANVKPGQPLEVSTLTSTIFKSPEEQRVLQRIFNTIPRIPATLFEFQTRFGRVPRLQELSEQFDFKIAGEMDLVLRLMEADPRLPRFLTRSPASGEISRMDIGALNSDHKLAEAVARSIVGWEGQLAPNFAMLSVSTLPLNSAQFRGQPYLLYFSFTNCQPCLETTPILVRLHAKYSAKGFNVIAANADKMMDLPYTDLNRADYIRKQGIRFTVGHVTTVMQHSYSVALYPAMFFVNRQGRVEKHLVGIQSEAAIDAAIQEALK